MNEEKKMINPCIIDKDGNLRNDWNKLFLMNPSIVIAILEACKAYEDSKFHNISNENEIDILKMAVEIYKRNAQKEKCSERESSHEYCVDDDAVKPTVIPMNMRAPE